MNTNKNIIIGIVAVAVAGSLAILFSSKQKTKRRLAKISNEGYETAYDVLYPLKLNRNYRWSKEPNDA